MGVVNWNYYTCLWYHKCDSLNLYVWHSIVEGVHNAWVDMWGVSVHTQEYTYIRDICSLISCSFRLSPVSGVYGVSLICMASSSFQRQNGNLLPHCSWRCHAPLSTHPPQAPTTRPPFGPTMCAAVVSVLMCQVFYLRVLPTLILFGPLARETALQKINFNIRKSRFESLSLRGVIWWYIHIW